MNNLEIVLEKLSDELIIKCTGRLDANRAGQLNDYVDRLVREGHYQISLDLTGVEYLSSVGIRTLISQNKNLSAVNGYFRIKAMSENVRQVLNMVGLAEILGQKPGKPKKTQSSGEKNNHFEAHGFNFSLTALSPKNQTELNFFGDPELLKISGYANKDVTQIKSGDNKFGIGLGALGDTFDDCKDRFGEFIQLGKSIAYLPGDGSKKPDYIVGTGQLVASLTALYGFNFTGNFSYLVRFESTDHLNTISVSDLAENLTKITGSTQLAVVMIAESAGLIGASINASPIDGKKIFTFPEIKETVNFTTEPAHNKALTLTVGLFSNMATAENKKYLRPLSPNNPMQAHLHSAVFSYVALKKTDINLAETIDYLFETTELKDILHLANDSREITGLGESRFVQGFCWIAPVD
ncbi:MAG: STAS domain-containing protein [Bacteroidales bacterium]|nr:STAS domain-containing protein [Bacteroidales bacterium]